MQNFFFSVTLQPNILRNYYTGQAQRLSVIAENGQRLELPLHVLRPFVNHHGISGRFKVTIDEHRRFVQLERA